MCSYVVGREYSYGMGGGIVSSTPKNIVGAVFRETICMGSTYLSPQQIRDVVHNLRLSFTDSNYNMVTQCVRVDSVMNSNCNHFSNEFCKIIVGKEIPSYINRCASIAGHFPSLANHIIDYINSPEAVNSSSK